MSSRTIKYQLQEKSINLYIYFSLLKIEKSQTKPNAEIGREILNISRLYFLAIFLIVKVFSNY